MSLFRRFFKNIVRDTDPQDDTVSVKNKPKPKYYGTVTPYPDFNASADASVLESAIKSKGVEEDVIVAVLVKRSNEQRQKIKAVYEASTGRRLDEDLKSALRSDLEDGLGTDEAVLVEILATRSNKEIEEIKRVFKEEYKEDLEQDVKDDTSGDFTQALLAMLKANKDESKDIDLDLARKDAEILFEAGETGKKVDVSTLINILTTRSGPQLTKTFHQYACVSDITLPKALTIQLSGDIEDCLIDIVKCAWNTPAFFAEKLHLAMKGHGTCEKTLIRVLVSRSEVDLKKIVEEYRAMYDNSLHEDILHDTKGHYQKVLLGLCGPY
ncbi:unnamed protein product [Menidia menidia]|uniref:Annexin n=1 Tax=Menidia menidia TaxID=238744 RepID=A0A8S4AN61_9TELE|nr:unnamed protein product [Menidia menidia]